MKGNYYELLGVENFSTMENIKMKYKEIVKKCHPDKGGDSGKFQEVLNAFEKLKDVEFKNEYDKKLKCG
jgi:curved DNA-binding protein CbpA